MSSFVPADPKTVGGNVASHPAPKLRAFTIRVAEVEADEHSGRLHLPDNIPEPRIIARGAGHAAVEREADAVGSEEDSERLDNRRTVAGVG